MCTLILGLLLLTETALCVYLDLVSYCRNVILQNKNDSLSDELQVCRYRGREAEREREMIESLP